MTATGIMSGWDEALAAGELRFPKCRHCGSWNWYPLARCRACGSGEFCWTRVAPRGSVHSWTRVHRAFSRDQGLQVPYVTAIVDIADAPGVRLACLQEPGGEPPGIGEAVELAVRAGPAGRRWTFDRPAT